MSWRSSRRCSLSRKELQRIFERLDRNGDGYVKSEEVSHMILQGMQGILLSDQSAASHDSLIITHDDLHSLIITITKPTLDFIDFVLFYQTLQLTTNITKTIHEDHDQDDVLVDVKKAFRVFDVNGDGVITPEELGSVLTRLGMWNHVGGLGSDCDTMSMIKTYDANSDGVLDFQEFNNMLLHHANHHS